MSDSKAVRILIVEDDDDDVVLIKQGLRERHALEFSVVCDGDEACRFLKREEGFEKAPRPDLILMDLNMPKVSGHEVLEMVKNDSRLRTIPVIILTTSDNENDILNAYAHGANCYVQKGFSFEEFQSSLEHLANFWFDVVSLPRPQNS